MFITDYFLLVEVLGCGSVIALLSSKSISRFFGFLVTFLSLNAYNSASRAAPKHNE